MNKRFLRTSIGEVLIIVLGVLLALAVDDWRQSRQDRALEAALLERMRDELLADAADLASARREVLARLWVLDAVLAHVGDQAATLRLRPELLDSLQNPVAVDSLRAEVGRAPVSTLDPIERPLATFLRWPEFDLSDGAYQEMLATGSLRIVRDAELRSAVMLYYRTAEDQGGNERQAGQYQERLEDALGSIGVAVGDELSLAELASRARTSSTLPVAVRRAQNRMRVQLGYYATIERARRRLEAALSTWIAT